MRIRSFIRSGTPRLVLAMGAAGLFLGCAGHSLERFEAISRVAGKDDFPAAAETVKKNQGLYGGQSRLLYNMDLGLLYHYAGSYDSSIAYLSKAVQIHDDLFAHSVSNEAASLLTNDNSRPYRGKPYEIVMLHQYLAFDYLALDRFDDARVEVKQAELYLEEIKRKTGKDAKAYSDDGMFRYFSALIYQAVGADDDAAISYYQAVKAYRQGAVPLPPSVARQAYAALAARNRRDDIRELKLEGDENKAETASQDQGEIVLVGSAGRSPNVDQIEFWGTWVRDGLLVFHYRDPNGKVVTEALPAPGLPPSELGKAGRGQRTRSGTTFHLKFTMPTLKSVPSTARFFTVTGDGIPAPVKTESLTELENLLAQYLNDSRSSTLIRTVIRVLIRTIAAEETKSGLSGDNPFVNLLVNVGTDVLADQLEQSDTRAWFLLPRNIQVVRIPLKPGAHSVTVQIHDASGNPMGTRTFDNVQVKAGRKKFLFYSSLR